ncbi:MAG: DoxX family rane protein [Nonomuraea muscovyensis]|nr:DoxX family rane protein [Nonomuraea muscovyensis]
MTPSGQTSTVKQALRDIAALVARLGVGGIVFANGWHKLEEGLNSTGADFLAQGAPAPRAWATVTMLAELIGGALLIAGLIVPVVGLLLFAESLAVFLVAPPLNPISLNELILLGVAALLLAVVGAGRVSVDHMVVIRRRESAAASEFAADTEADRVIASLRDPDDPPGTAAGGTPVADARAEGGEAGDGAPGGSKGDLADRMADTAPQPAADLPAADPAPADESASSAVPGDTLVAGSKKPRPRGRRAPSGD